MILFGIFLMCIKDFINKQLSVLAMRHCVTGIPLSWTQGIDTKEGDQSCQVGSPSRGYRLINIKLIRACQPAPGQPLHDIVLWFGIEPSICASGRARWGVPWYSSCCRLEDISTRTRLLGQEMSSSGSPARCHSLIAARLIFIPNIWQYLTAINENNLIILNWTENMSS